MQIPKRVRDGVQLLAEDALIVVGLSLSAVGIVELSGWSSKELIQHYTPLLLAMFSIIVTVSALRLNIKEGRDRARRERDQGVRPVLVAKAVDYAIRQRHFGVGQSYQRMECFLEMPNRENTKVICMSIENAGLGVALNANLFMACEDGSIYKATSEIDKIAVNEKVFVQLNYALPNKVIAIYTNPIDIFDNEHYCRHFFSGEQFSHSENLIESNYYISKLRPSEYRNISKALSRDPLSIERSIQRNALNRVIKDVK